MQKTYYVLLFVLLLSAAAKAQTGWVTQKLDETVSVKFPTTPQKITKNGGDSYSVKGKDSIQYVAAVVDFAAATHTDANALAEMVDKPEFAEGLKQGFTEKKLNYSFGDMTVDKWKTYNIYNITGTENTNKSKLFTHMLFVGTKMYILSCMVPASLNTKLNEVFLSSADLLK